MKILEQAAELVRLQKENLDRVEKELGEAFAEAYGLIHGARGNVIVVGVGKSASAAAKVSASLRGAGARAFSLHPPALAQWERGAEAKDVMLIISPTGESEQVLRFLPGLRRRGVKVVTLTSLPRSSLARASDVVLRTVPPGDDADSHLEVSAPLSALVVGEILALLLLADARKKKKVRLAGGDAEEKAYTVADIMASRPKNPAVARHCVVKDALGELTNKGLGAVSVVDDGGKLLGIVTDGDVRRLLQRSVGSLSRIFLTSVEDIMTANPKRVTESSAVAEALELMEKLAITVLPVVNEKDEPVGMVHLHDLVQISLLKKRPKRRKKRGG
ncbi:MAG: CBS domain-containing protein [bacterium]